MNEKYTNFNHRNRRVNRDTSALRRRSRVSFVLRADQNLCPKVAGIRFRQLEDVRSVAFGAMAHKSQVRVRDCGHSHSQETICHAPLS